MQESLAVTTGTSATARTGDRRNDPTGRGKECRLRPVEESDERAAGGGRGGGETIGSSVDVDEVLIAGRA